ncbi:MAG: two-component system sensor histidine kinase NtrB [Nitrospinota bacterium]
MNGKKRIDIESSLLHKRLTVLIAGRLVVLSIYLFIAVYFQQQDAKNLEIVFSFIPVVAGYFLTIIYTAALPYIKDLQRFTILQLIIDTILITVAIYYSGGISSPFSYLYLLTIISTSIFLTSIATYAIAASCGFILSLMIWLEYAQIIDPPNVFYATASMPNLREVQLALTVYIAIMALVAYLASYFSSLLKSSDKLYLQTSVNLKNLQSFNKNVLESMGSGLIAVDQSGIIFAVNPATTSILGIDSHAMVDTPIELIFKDESFLALLNDLLSSAESIPYNRNVEIQYKSVNGDNKFLSINLSSYLSSDNNLAAIVVFNDLTASRLLEQKLREDLRFAMLGKLASGVAHEIRNPLGSISGSIQVINNMVKVQADPKINRLLGIIEREVDRLDKIATSFLDLPKPITLKLEKLNIATLLKETVSLVKSNPTYKEDIIIEEDYDEQIVCELDKDQFQQVLWNVIKNGVEALEGGRILRISSRLTSDKNYMELLFSDDGSGIDSNVSDMIFDPFFTTKQGGTGLGLATSKKIVEAHNGTIELSAQKNSGTEFIVKMPLTN